MARYHCALLLLVAADAFEVCPYAVNYGVRTGKPLAVQKSWLCNEGLVLLRKPVDLQISHLKLTGGRL